MDKRYLTKSRFKEGLECPTKLYYSKNSDYQNNQLEDSFLESLAEGGYQVGELAKFLISDNPYIDDITVESLDYVESVKLTNHKLENEEVSIAEPAFLFNNLFVRVDLLQKKGNEIDIYEVKSKSWGYESVDDQEFKVFIKEYKRGENEGKRKIDPNWKFYLYDIAFQRYVVRNLFPSMKINTHLVLADKLSKTSIDGLNQYFKISNKNGRKSVEVSGDLNITELGKLPLKVINVDQVCDFIEKEKIGKNSFENHIEYLSKLYKQKIRDWKKIDHDCFKCQYRNDSFFGLKSGFHECFKNSGYNLDEESNLVERIWRATKKETDKGNFLIDQVNEEEYIDNEVEDENGMSTSFRQYIQIKKDKERDNTPYYHEYLSDVIQGLEKPYHFIDFETSGVAIPFHKNRSPYESVAFQYSYHLYDDDKIEHKGEYLNTNPEFPNYSFIRSLKNEFSPNLKGTIFRYHNHENTILNKIYTQLINESSIEVPDRNELIDFIKEISQPTRGNRGEWKPTKNNMVDLYKLIVSLYYSPYSKGSNSIKYILPSVINDSSFLKTKYSKPIYGTNQIPSKNFSNHSWLNDKELDPYKSLPPVFSNINDDYVGYLNGENLSFSTINDGGAAMTAYAYLQFGDLDQNLKESIRKSLLKYCELDTMAMVMIFEHFLEKTK
ncbi:DUF2779 domain-containing protein [Flavobacteriaceae bacterium]|uniref:DUF2779 domain-containing protein n=1 Tax=Candidatus Arcticimaribacter forsetii TaxID=2820661 RepID=UPI0020779319|nr:DUF2779 domain-containing protein [Candidatus Arcticimaribacter forsetii]MDA8699136.1 DUF2779 domain-containing protein [Flavobacteriaceae bacterium]MDB2328914.1 DUF2779 domain-containing protein [Flavobacteriaceae bacterium]MDB2345212.1 DUF2779 domain-containing protein [Flavobacteriaceae bacterium]